MKINRISGVLFCVLIFFSGIAFAQLQEIGIFPFDVSLGGRSLGMGNAFVGLADDVNALLYNPGGLAWAKGVSLTVKDLENITAVQAYPTGYNASLGLAVVTSKISNLPIATGSANTQGALVSLGYGTKLTFLPILSGVPLFQHLGFGINLKGLVGQTLRRDTFPDQSGSGFDLDLGVLWRGGEWWSVGMAAQNILPQNTLGGGVLNWDSGGQENIPATGRLGFSARLISESGAPIFMEGRDLVLAGEVGATSSKQMLANLGAELGFGNRFYLRSGVSQQNRTDLNFGLGFRGENWGLDLANARSTFRDERYTYVSLLYFPQEWVVVKKLEVEKPVLVGKGLEKISLQDDFVTYDDRLEVSGRVKPGVEVFINDLPVALDADNNFYATVPLHLEKNLIKVEIVFQGEKKSWNYKVLRKIKVQISEEKTLAEELKHAVTKEEKEKLAQAGQQLAEKKEKVEALATLGVIEVTPEAGYSLNAGITRGELATWLVKAANLTLSEVKADLYKDVPRNHPLAPYIKAVTDLKLLKPFPDGTFRPKALVTRQEGEEIFRQYRRLRP